MNIEQLEAALQNALVDRDAAQALADKAQRDVNKIRNAITALRIVKAKPNKMAEIKASGKARRDIVWAERESGKTWAQVGAVVSVSGERARQMWHRAHRERFGLYPKQLEMNSRNQDEPRRT